MPGLYNVDIGYSIPDVNGWLNTLNNYADDAVSSANSVASSLTSFSTPVYDPGVVFDSISTNISATTIPKPVAPSITTGTKPTPTGPNITAPTVTIGAVPTFTETFPELNIPNVPNPLAINAPVKDFIIDTSMTYPVEPDGTLPSVPTLLSLDLPVAETVLLPIFDLDFPTSSSILVPGVTFSFTEDIYSSPLLTKVKDELLNRLTNSTGINTVVEQAIWDRGKDRESRASLLAERTLLVDRSTMGFSRPTGAALAALDAVIQDTQSKLIELSREIMIKQAELEQENVKTSIQQTLGLEDILIRENNNKNQRSFEVAKYVQDIAVEIFKLAISKYNSEVEAYKSFSTAYTARVQAELAKIEIFKSEIEAEKLKGDINEQNIKIYLAQIEGVKQNVEIYKSLIAAVSQKLQAEQLKIEVYKTDIEAYSSQVKAKSEEYSIYSEQIKGELAKTTVYDTKVKAFASRVQAYAAQSDVTIKAAETSIASQGLNIKKYEADIDAYIKQVQADQLIYQAAVDLYKGETQMYLADVGYNSSAADLALKNSENIITQNKYKADIGIQNAQVYLSSLNASYNAVLEGKRAAGSIYQSIGSSALSAINVSASVSGQSSLSGSESHSYEGI